MTRRYDVKPPMKVTFGTATKKIKNYLNSLSIERRNEFYQMLNSLQEDYAHFLVDMTENGLLIGRRLVKETFATHLISCIEEFLADKTYNPRVKVREAAFSKGTTNGASWYIIDIILATSRKQK